MTLGEGRDAGAAGSEAGFTIVELLVSLAILGMMAGLLASGIGLSGRLSAASTEARSGADAVANTQLLLHQRITQLLPLQRLTSSDPTIEMNGNRGEFRFAGAPAGQAQPDSTVYYRLLLKPTGELTLLTASDLDDRINLQDASLVGWTPHTLLRDVSTLDITYFGADRLFGPPHWQSVWNNRPQPPDLVRIRVEFAAGDRRVWPDLVVRPRTTGNTLCRIDAQTGRCEAR